MSESGTYRIRPAGRHLLTIGRDLIQDPYAAVVELVKNAYDADSPDVLIEFKAKPDQTGYTVIIEDHGHGMSRDTVINKWMVPSTPDKLERKYSPKGRILQGRKGIGRYAASILGTELLLETVTSDGDRTKALLIWSEFEKAKYLDEVEVPIKTDKVANCSVGTKLTITSDYPQLAEWDENQFKKLKKELRKLISPLSLVAGVEQDEEKFDIYLSVDKFHGVEDYSDILKPLPIFDLFDYRITGEIEADGKGKLRYSQQNVRNSVDEVIPFDAGKPTNCGKLFFDIRVFDRDKDAIESLIRRGMRDDAGNYLGKLDAQNLLNTFNGVGVYRNSFRIRPLGDPDFDWLKLNEQRIQNPSMRIGSNQVIGYVQIQSEEETGLVEKSARDGLRENEHYDRLKEITRSVVNKLEERRFQYRRKAGFSKPTIKIERELERLFSFEPLKQEISEYLYKRGVNKTTTAEIIEIINRDTDGRNRIADDIRNAVAIYQGQATLGKIIEIVVHEGRRPLSHFRNQIPRLHKKIREFKAIQSEVSANAIQEIADGIGISADSFVKLFHRLDPLAAGRARRASLLLKEAIEKALRIFDTKLQEQGVSLIINCSGGFSFSTWQQDINAIFTNLVENSLYWINNKHPTNKKISITVVTNREELLYIDYRDTGPGIEPRLIESGVIFEPNFSTKNPPGTGLGLAIAGEAAMRSGLELKAIESEGGAYFRLQPKDEKHG